MSARVAARIDRRRLGDAPFTIISNDCWGGTAYQKLGRPYNTPFVGMFVEPTDFARLVGDLGRYLATPLRFAGEATHPDGAAYPVGDLGDVRLHFLHYASEVEAREKWERRVRRMDWDHIRVQCQDRDGLADNVPAGTLVLGPRDAPGVLGVRDYVDNGALLYNLSLQEFDVVEWLRSGGIVAPRAYQRVLHGLAREKRGLMTELHTPLVLDLAEHLPGAVDGRTI